MTHELTRYGMEARTDWQSRTWVHAAIDVGGEWVKFSDVSALLIAQAAQLETVRQENERLKAALESIALYPLPAYDLPLSGHMVPLANADQLRTFAKEALIPPPPDGEP